jgi:hypothetical protein
MAVRSFTQIMADHAERCRVASVLMSDPVPEDSRDDMLLGVSPRISHPRMMAEPKYPPVSDSEWDHLTGR